MIDEPLTDDQLREIEALCEAPGIGPKPARPVTLTRAQVLGMVGTIRTLNGLLMTVLKLDIQVQRSTF